MSNKTIIIATVSFLLISFVFLSWSEKKQSDINSKNIWMVYFQNPKDNSLDFTIENHSTTTSFEYKILKDKDILKQESVSASKGETKIIPVSLSEQEGKIVIEVSDQKNKKEIYKVF